MQKETDIFNIKGKNKYIKFWQDKFEEIQKVSSEIDELNRVETINELKKFIGEDDFSLLLKYPKNATIMEDRPWIGKYKQPQYIQKVESLLNVPGAIENLQHYGYLD